MNIENIGDLVQRARAEAASKAASKPDANPGSERDRLMRVAQEFESMLMLQMLKEMRKAGSWDDEEQSEGGFGAQTMFETIDVELAGHLTKAQGLGLGKQLMDAFQRLQPEGKVGGSTEQDPPYAVPGVSESGGRWRIVLPAGVELDALWGLAARHNLLVRKLTHRRDTLEEIFLKAMGHLTHTPGEAAALAGDA